MDLEGYLLKIYTGFGDKGKTRLYGGQIVDKDNIRVEAYGAIDELNSAIGVVKTYIENNSLINDLQNIQNSLFELSAELATPDNKNVKSPESAITNKKIKDIEKDIDKIDNQLDPLKNFILPGGSPGAASCHLARTICRRAERALVSLNKVETIHFRIVVYINRLSDYLFVVARFLNKEQNIPDLPWLKK
jgi:cob(I)alamin adenosyltransferase